MSCCVALCRYENCTCPFFCPDTSASRTLGDTPDDETFTTPGHQPQLAWAEGNEMKMFGCVGRTTSLWQFFLYSLFLLSLLSLSSLFDS